MNGVGEVTFLRTGTLGKALDNDAKRRQTILGVNGVLNGGTIGATIGGEGCRGLFSRSGEAGGLAFFKESGKLRLDKEKKNRFSPLCCALLLGIFPLVSMAANGTITNSISIGSITNNGSLVSIINQSSGTIAGHVSNFSGGFTLSNSGMIGGSILNSSTGDVYVINSSSGSIVGGMRNYKTGTLSVANHGRIGGVGSTQDSFASQNGVAVLTNYADGVIEGVLRSLVTGVLDVTNQGTFTQSVGLQGSGVSTIRNDSSGVIMGIIKIFSDAGYQSINNAGIIQGNVDSTSPSIVDFTNSGTIIMGVMNSGSGAINATNSRVIGAINRNTANVFITKSGSATLVNSGIVYGNLNAQGGSVYLTSNTGTITGSVLNGSGGTISVNNNPNGLIRGVVRNGAISSNSNGTATVNNQGTILGGVGSSSGVLNVTNSGVIGTRSSLNAEVFVAEARARATLVNTGTIYGSFRASSGSTISLNQNSGTIVGSIANYSSGVNSITNSIDGLIQGTISNDDIGFTTIYNVGSITGTVGNTNARGRLSLNNTGNITGNINNGGTATLNNSGTIRGTVSNTGSGTFNISSTDGTIVNITNAGAAAIVTNAGGIITSVNNTGAGTLTINSNSGTISSIINSGSSASIFNRTNSTITFINNQAGGTAVINNQTDGRIGDISNVGVLASFTNSGTILGTLDNQVGGVISSNIENTDSAFILGGIKNAGTMAGTISNASNSGFSITNVGFLTNVINSNGTLSLTHMGGNVISVSNTNTGTLNVNSTGGSVATLANNGNTAIINNDGANIGVINNTTTATITNSSGNIINISNANTGTLNVNSTGGTIATLTNNGNTAVINTSGTGTINTLNNQGTLSTLSNSGSIATLNNLGSINNNLINNGALGNFINNGTLLGSLENQVAGTIIDLSNTGSIRDSVKNVGSITRINNSSALGLNISNTGFVTNINSTTMTTITNNNGGNIATINNQRGSSTLNNVTGGIVGFILNADDASLSLGNNQGIVIFIANQGTVTGNMSNSGTIRTLYNDPDGIMEGSISNTGFIDEIDNEGSVAGDISNSGTIRILYNEFYGAIEGGIDNTGSISEINNEGVIAGTISHSSNSNLKIKNSGAIEGGIKALNSASIDITNGEDSVLGSVYNGGLGSIILSGLTTIVRAANNSGYDITNEGRGSINVKNLFIDLQPYAESYQNKQNFSDAYANRISLGGSGLGAIGVDHVTLRLVDSSLLDTFLAKAINISQLINGALGSTDRNAHDCSGVGDSGCRNQSDPDGDVHKVYVGDELISGLKDNVGDESFISVEGAHSFALTLADKYGNFNVVAKPESSGAAHLNKVLLSSIRKRTNFVSNIATASIGEFKYYLYHSPSTPRTGPTNPSKFPEKLNSSQSSYYDTSEFYASLESDLTFQNASTDGTAFILPYFASHSVSLENEGYSKGHSTGIVLGYTSLTAGDAFYSIYGGYEDVYSKSDFYDMRSRAWYMGFKLSDPLKRLGDNVELVAQYDGNIARMQNSIKDNDEDVNVQANPKSYAWSLGADLGVNFFQGKSIFVPQLGLGYEGGIIDAYRLDMPFEKTKINTYHTRVKMAWARDWNPHLQTILQAGLRYYFNPNTEFNYELMDDRVNGSTRLARWNQFLATDFIVPLNQAFYFKLSYNGIFSKDGNSHTGLVKFDYLF